ncbi:PQQ-binding-like beta-propeller repeat protein [Dyadobacter sp. NIV53]|uniref:outer membrane protein assembly factor BamB family protein n=1 Tax=Dyadobacter sp. NIV53 TaxID=2861765 RepID=UPI001C87A173|nr:PQQ-binding-like beta-propeller repeat protein [Dyadobacter sp. NIV53]
MLSVTKMNSRKLLFSTLTFIVAVLGLTAFVGFRHGIDTKDPYSQWTVYGGGSDNIKYSSLAQINTENVGKLKVAWEYSAGEASPTNTTDMKVNPLIINGVFYGLNPQLKLFALEAATGKVKWVYDPVSIPVQGKNTGRGPFGPSTKISRGLTYYRKGNDQRIFYTPGGGHMLYCVNALTGKLITSFGNNGRIDLHDDLDMENAHDLHISNTSPGIIYKDLIILGSRLSEVAASAPGHVRAYDVHTGKRKWIFHTIPHPGEAGYESWENPDAYKYVGGANVWGGFCLDEKRGLVFAGTGSATPDFYGGNRKGNNLYANSILALDAATGKLKWHYQTVHHDLWDYDHAAHPILVTVKKDNPDGRPRDVDAVVQVTKQGFIFMFNRETGEPIHPINEIPVPKSELAGEWTSPTQPVPTFFKPFVRQRLTEADLLREGIPDSSYQDILKRFRSYKTDNMWNPPSLQGTIQSPGWNGGAEWGGPTFDPTSGLMYINGNESPWIMKMDEVKKTAMVSKQTNLEAGELLYKTNCSGCHGQDRRGGEGNPALAANPSLLNISKKSNMSPGMKFDEPSFKSLITSGRNNMPPFSHLSAEQKTALASFILDLDELKKQPFKDSNINEEPEHFRSPYSFSGGMTGGGKFLTKEGYPAVAPPWGHLTAVDLNTGKEVWKQTIGDYPEMKAKGIHTGSENFGGSVVTAGGLVFIAATRDEKIRAFNKKTGELLWEADLPAAGIATPAVYEVNGKQFVVIACGGGGKQRTKSGDKYLAFALPDSVK